MELKINKPSSDSPVVIKGSKVDGVESYLGIPYAKPPVGDLRLKEPVPVSLYDYDTLDATKFGNASIQGIPVFNPNGLGDDIVEEEDCLYLNIWTSGTDKKKPVVFWLHGGGFFVWSSSIKLTNGAALAKENDVVVVSFNYRLGALGFLHTGANKSEEELKASDEAHCNFGLLDWAAALSWVSKHIHHFGGDPDNVTVLGQSAGAAAAYMLLSTPKAEGLFHKLILVSRGGDDSYGYEKVAADCGMRLLEGSKKYAEFLVDKELNENDNIQELLATVPVEKIKQSFLKFFSVPPTPENGGPLCVFTQVIYGPIVDEKTLLSDFTPWAKSNVKIVLGNTTHEGRFFIKPSGTFQFPDPTAVYTKEMLAMITKTFTGTDDEKLLNKFYNLEGKEDTQAYFDAIDHLMTTAVFQEPSYAFAQKLAASKSAPPAYMYYFTRVCPGAKKTNELAYHCVDVPYIFGNLHQRRALKDLILTDNQEEEGYFDDIDFQLSKDIRHALFTTFAHTGIPTSANGEAWPSVSKDLKITVLDKQFSTKPFEELKSPLLNYIYELRQKSNR